MAPGVCRNHAPGPVFQERHHTLRARAEVSQLGPWYQVRCDQGLRLAFGWWVSQVLQLDTRLWTVSQLNCFCRLVWTYSLSGPHFLTKELTAPLFSQFDPACWEEDIFCVTVSAADLLTMHPPHIFPGPQVFSAQWGRYADWESDTSCEWRMVFIFTTSRVFVSLSHVCNKKEYRKVFVIVLTCLFCLLFTFIYINSSRLWKSEFVNYFLLMYKANIQTHQNK